jgi:MFS family permease
MTAMFSFQPIKINYSWQIVGVFALQYDHPIKINYSWQLVGVLALQYDRPVVLASGTACWAISTAAVGLSQQFQQVAFWRAINGLGLAIVIPVLQSLIADSYAAGSRGAGFGLFGLVGAIGRVGGGTLATIMAGHEYWGIPGWRFAFLNMASISLLIGVLVYLFVVDPRNASLVHSSSEIDSERYVSFVLHLKEAFAVCLDL